MVKTREDWGVTTHSGIAPIEAIAYILEDPLALLGAGCFTKTVLFD